MIAPRRISPDATRLARYLILGLLLAFGSGAAWQLSVTLRDRADGMTRYVRVDVWAVQQLEFELQRLRSLLASHVAGDPEVTMRDVADQLSRFRATIPLLQRGDNYEHFRLLADIDGAVAASATTARGIEQLVADRTDLRGDLATLRAAEGALSVMTIRLRQLAIDVAALRSELQDGDLANVRWLVNVNRWLMIAFSSVAMIFIVLLVKEARDARRAERQALASEQRTRHVAEHDLLTDLPNRLMFHRLLSDALERTQARGSAAALILCDIDDFREINETLGHDLGDTLLVATARRLRSLLGEGDVLARLGSDEFAILRPQAADMPAGTAADSAAAIEGLRAAFDAPFIWGDRTVSVTLSFGIACFPRDAGDVESLLRAADLALQTAKAEDRRCVRVYRPEMSRDLLERKALEADLQAAIAAGDIEVHFQPQIRLADGRFLGAEALARWRHPERGWISPGVFIPLAEKSGLIGALAEQVLETACREALRWPGGAGADSIVAVNVSPAQFAYEDVFSQVQAVLARIPFPARRLELEITEGLLMRDVRAALVILDQFSALGIRLAIDDFGTGYSSLNYLKHFPLHKLKIDQSFVRDLLNSDSDRMIVETIVSLAVGLGLRTIAEGIETEAHHQLLRELGCDEGQGYWYGRPMPGDDLLAWLAAWEDRPTDVAARSERAA